MLKLSFAITDFAGFCNTVLTPTTAAMQSASSDECARAIALLGRAISGVQEFSQALALIDQVWALVGSSIARHHQADAKCRISAVQLFLNVIPALDANHTHIQREIVDLSLRWYAETMSSEILKCCSAIVVKEKENATFGATIEQMIPVRTRSCASMLLVCMQKLRYQPHDSDSAVLHARLSLLCFVRKSTTSRFKTWTRASATSRRFARTSVMWTRLRRRSYSSWRSFDTCSSSSHTCSSSRAHPISSRCTGTRCVSEAFSWKQTIRYASQALISLLNSLQTH